MRALELGKVSRDKQQQATTSNDTITADRDKRNWHWSQQEAPKPCKTNTSNVTREAMATFCLDATGQPCQRTQQECCEGIVSITTKLTAWQQLSLQWCHRCNSCASKQTGGPSSTGSLEQIGQIHHPDLLRRNPQDQWKQKQAAKTSAAAWRVEPANARNTRSTNSASESTGSVRDTIPRQQDEREQQQQQQHHIILVWFLK